MTNKFREGDKVKFNDFMTRRVETGVIIEASFERNRTNYLIKKDDGKYVAVFEEDIRRIGDENRKE